MRNLILPCLTAALCLSTVAPAAAQRDLIELFRSDLRTEKMAIVTRAMQLTEDESERFWPVYREYELEMAEINDERVALIKHYTATHASMSEKDAKHLIARSFKLQEARTRTLKKYVSKMGQALDMKTAARWGQVEHAINAVIDLQLGSALPLIR